MRKRKAFIFMKCMEIGIDTHLINIKVSLVSKVKFDACFQIREDDYLFYLKNEIILGAHTTPPTPQKKRRIQTSLEDERRSACENDMREVLLIL